MKTKYIVAVKDASGKEIRPGKILGSFRKEEYARHAFPSLTLQAGYGMWDRWRVGIFFNGKLVS